MGVVRVLAVSDQVHDGLAAGMTAGMTAGKTAGPGNHDPDLSGYRQSRTGLFTLARFPVTPPWPDGALSADGRVIDAAGLRIAGRSGTRRAAARSRASWRHTAAGTDGRPDEYLQRYGLARA
jgi:hypothetical protein